MKRLTGVHSRVVLFGVIALLLSSLVIAACGSDDSDDESAIDMPMDGDASLVEPAMDQEMAEQEESAAYAIDPARASSGGAGESAPPQSQINPDRLIIRTATITLTVESTLEATASVRNIAAGNGGFVFSSTTYSEDDQQYAQLTIRIPASNFDDTISELRGAPWVTEVNREESSSQDVSAEYVDNESRLNALEETQRRYLALLAEADTIESILRLESELTNVRSQIESIKGRQNYLSEMTDFGTITVTVRPADAVEKEDPDDEFSIARIFESAWDRSTGALSGFAEALVVVVIFAAFFSPLAVLAYVVYRFVRRMLVRERREAATQPPVD